MASRLSPSDRSRTGVGRRLLGGCDQNSGMEPRVRTNEVYEPARATICREPRYESIAFSHGRGRVEPGHRAGTGRAAGGRAAGESQRNNVKNGHNGASPGAQTRPNCSKLWIIVMQ